MPRRPQIDVHDDGEDDVECSREDLAPGCFLRVAGSLHLRD